MTTEVHKKRSILVVDDDDLVRQAVCKGLTAEGYKAVGVSGGAYALDRALQQQFDAMVLDIRMPEMDGFEALNLISRLCPNMQVIILSGMLDPESRFQTAAIQGGVFAYLKKPCRLQELSDTLMRAFISKLKHDRRIEDLTAEERHVGELTQEELDRPIGDAISDGESPRMDFFRFDAAPNQVVHLNSYVVALVRKEWFGNRFLIGRVGVSPEAGSGRFDVEVLAESIDGLLTSLTDIAKSQTPVFFAPDRIIARLKQIASSLTNG